MTKLTVFLDKARRGYDDYKVPIATVDRTTWRFAKSRVLIAKGGSATLGVQRYLGVVGLSHVLIRMSIGCRGQDGSRRGLLVSFSQRFV